MDEPVLEDRRPGWERAATGLTLGLGLAALVVAWSAAVVRNPPRVEPQWPFGAALAVAAVLIAFRRSAQPGVSWLERAALGLAMLPSLAALLLIADCWYANFHDLPWPTTVAVLLLLALGGWRARQGWLALLVAAAVTALAVPALRPPVDRPLPESVSTPDLTLTLRSFDGDGGGACFLSIRPHPDARPRRSWDLEHVTLTAGAAPYLPVDAWHPFRWARADDVTPGEAAYLAHAFPPHWLRSVDLLFSVPYWPPQPAASVSLPVPAPGAPAPPPARAQAGGIRLEASTSGWGPSRTTSPSPACLALTVSYSGLPGPGFSRSAIRVSDERGRVLPLHGFTGGGDDRGTRLETEVQPDPAVRRLTIDLFRPSDLDACQEQFLFARLPNRPTRHREW